MVTFTWEGVPCARLSVEAADNGGFNFIEESYDPAYGWLPSRIERFATIDEAEYKYEDRCNWYIAGYIKSVWVKADKKPAFM